MPIFTLLDNQEVQQSYVRVRLERRPCEPEMCSLNYWFELSSGEIAIERGPELVLGRSGIGVRDYAVDQFKRKDLIIDSPLEQGC
jgi:hypothetical protein